METEFGFYDFAGYIIPGALVLLLCYWFFTGFFALPLPLEINDIGESILFLIASYCFGHLVQAMGNSVENRYVKKWGGQFSDQFLREDNSYYTPEFKSNLKTLASQVFALSLDTSLTEEELQEKRRNEFFRLCYSLIVHEKCAEHTEIFNGIKGLYRGMLTTTWIGIGVSGLIILKHLSVSVLSSRNIILPQGAFWMYQEMQLGLGLVFLILFVLSLHPLESRLKRFSEHFVNSIYRSFYVWCKRKEWKTECDK